MKFLDSKGAIELLPVSENEAERMALLFESVVPVSCRGEASLQRLTSQGIYTVEQILFNGQPVFLFWWSKTTDGGLWIHACQSYDTHASISVAFLGGEAIQKREGCSYIRFMTLRRGLVQAAESHGWQVDGVILSKAAHG